MRATAASDGQCVVDRCYGQHREPGHKAPSQAAVKVRLLIAQTNTRGRSDSICAPAPTQQAPENLGPGLGKITGHSPVLN